MEIYSGNIIDVVNSRIFAGKIKVENGKISHIMETNEVYDNYISPGFIDAHIHIESSMLPPAEFARIAVKHGTVAAVCDAHEIANVLGIEGVKYMLDNAKQSPFKFYFSAPACVPATDFETSGAELGLDDIEKLFAEEANIKFLGEMMNFPAVIMKTDAVMDKIALAKKYGKKIDGHAPGLGGSDLEKYISAGISTDHESICYDEAREKLDLGMKIWIREGSAARNCNDLLPLIETHFKECAFCSDDKHPDDLIKSHINYHVSTALKNEIDLIKVFHSACLTPALHYGLDVGLLQEGDPADFIIFDDLKDIIIRETIIGGELVYSDGQTKLEYKPAKIVNNFDAQIMQSSDFSLSADEIILEMSEIPAIEVLDGQLITRRISIKPKIENGKVISDIENDILKIVVVNRYEKQKPQVALVKNFGLKSGAIASSVAHDSHNIIAVGVTDEDICEAVNAIIVNQGGICVASNDGADIQILPLPIAGLMSAEPYDIVAEKYSTLDAKAKQLGSKLTAPFMTLSFMALLVMPEIKLSDKGLFDGIKFEFINN